MEREEKRNVRIEFLRILTMLLIVIHHILLHGGILGEADHFLPQHKSGSFTGFLEYNPVIMLLAVIVTAFGIWLTGALIGRLRALIFKGLQVYKLCEWCEKNLTVRYQE